jgi:tripartite ATP-independent transporter DctM subunit
MRKELLFGFSIMILVVVGTLALMPWGNLQSGHVGLLMLALVVVAIMMGFPTAFTLMGMGVLFTFFAYFFREPDQALTNTLTLMVQRTYGVMNNDVLIAIPLFVFMGYLVERANLIEKLFKSLHLALVRVPGSLAVATIFTCAVFATATGIVGAVVTLMGLLALPQMLRSGYDIRVSAGAITAGGTLGILIPPSVMLIVYGATAGVSVVQLYAGAFFPGIMLAGLYVVYVIVLAKLKPHVMPPLPEDERKIKLPQAYENLRQSFSERVIPALIRGLGGASNVGVSLTEIAKTLLIALIPAIFFAVFMGSLYSVVTAPIQADETAGLQAMGIGMDGPADEADENEEEELVEITASPAPAQEKEDAAPAAAASTENQAPAERQPAPNWYWWMLGIGAARLVGFYLFFSWARLEIFKMLLGSFFPLAVLILAVLGSIVFGLATPTEAAAVGAIGGALLAAAYRRLNFQVVKESVFLTGKTSAMVCWLFVGSSIFSAAFALLGGQELVEKWVLGLGLTPVQFLVLSQTIIFLLGWPLEWTEIIVIFMPIFIPLLDNFGIDPLFFGLLVALNLQTAFLSPPVAMSAFYLKGVAPPHVTLNQIFAGMLPFMGIQVVAVLLLYVFPGIGMWLPTVLYR